MHSVSSKSILYACGNSICIRKKLTHHKIIDCIAEQTASVIIQVSKESKLRIHPNLWRPRFTFTYSFKFVYKCFLRLAFHDSYERH